MRVLYSIAESVKYKVAKAYSMHHIQQGRYAAQSRPNWRNTDMPPSDVQQLQSFPGMLKVIQPYIPNL